MNDPATGRCASHALRESLRELVDAADALLHAGVDGAEAGVEAAREALGAKVRGARAQLATRMHEMGEHARAAGHDGERFVRENPWASVGIGAGAGLLLGLLLRRH